MNFDGIIASAGAYIECGGREIYRHTAAPDQLARLVDYFEKTRTTYMLQTEQGGYDDRKKPEGHDPAFHRYGND